VAKFNLATQAHRQAGSAFKVFTLATALEDGVSPWSIWEGPPSIQIPDRRCYTNGAPWQVANYADEAAGTMTLAQATAHSVNTIFAQVVTQVGPENVAQMAHRMGIQSRLEPYCSITLGTEEVTPLEMTEAYATLAAQGVRHEPTPVAVVRGPDGSVIDRPLDPAGQQALWPNHANMITSILEDAVTSGTGAAAAIGRPSAGKTGTAQDYTNAWFCGYIPQLAACVWVGYPRGNISMRDVGGFPAVYGGSIPALIWHRFMSVATAGMPVQPFQPPSLVEFSTPTPTPSPRPHADALGVAITDALGVAITDALGRSDGHADADHLRLGVLVHDGASQPVAEPGGLPRTGLTWRMREGRRNCTAPPRNDLAIYRSFRPAASLSWSPTSFTSFSTSPAASFTVPTARLPAPLV
jgi:penicillin-binding protein 1A